MMKMNNFLSSDFFLMMVHGLQLDLYIAVLVNLSANMKKSSPNGVNIFFSVLIGLSLILYTVLIHSVTQLSQKNLRKEQKAEAEAEKQKKQSKIDQKRIMDVSIFNFQGVEDEESGNRIFNMSQSVEESTHPLPSLAEIYRSGIKWRLHPHTLSSVKPLIIALIVVLLYNTPFLQTGLLFGLFASQTAILFKFRIYQT